MGHFMERSKVLPDRLEQGADDEHVVEGRQAHQWQIL
jgi:hypothetical protein